MKYGELINNIIKEEMPDMEKVRKNCLRQPVRRSNRRALSAYAVAAAGVLAVCLVFGYILMGTGANNSFTLTAYAMERNADGVVMLRGFDVLDELEHRAFYQDNEAGIIYINVGLSLRYEGNNVRTVELAADVGHFAKQYVPCLDGSVTGMDGVNSHWQDGVLVRYGLDFIDMDAKVALADLSDDVLLFLVQPINADAYHSFRVIVTYTDNSRTERTVSVAKGSGLVIRSPEETENRGDGMPERFAGLDPQIISESVKSELEKFGISVASVQGVGYVNDYTEIRATFFTVGGEHMEAEIEFAEDEGYAVRIVGIWMFGEKPITPRASR
jgi:hypothetical protein